MFRLDHETADCLPARNGDPGVMKDTVLIVEDDDDITELVSLYLRRNEFEVLTSSDWKAVDLLQENSIDLVLLDIMLPGPSGFELCQEMRKYTDVPILIMSAKSSESDKILGLGLGADDYVTKPFSPSELVARVKAQLHRYKGLAAKRGRAGSPIRIADLEIDEECFQVSTPRAKVTLSAKEFQILMLMAQNPDRVFQPEDLFLQIWNSPALGDARTVLVHISNLRKKIEPDPSIPQYIVTIRGAGYKFNGEGAERR